MQHTYTLRIRRKLIHLIQDGSDCISTVDKVIHNNEALHSTVSFYHASTVRTLRRLTHYDQTLAHFHSD